MEVKTITYPKPNENYNKLLFHIKKKGIDLQFGTVFLSKNSRIPTEGFTQHPEHEISIIEEGKIEILNQNGSIKDILTAGKVIYINAGEPHAGNVLEDTKIIYLLVQ